MELDDPNDNAEENILTSRGRAGSVAVSDTLTTGHSDPSDRWLLALHDPLAGFYTFSSCVAFADLLNDGDMKLVIADLGNGMENMRLNVYRGTVLQTQIALVDVPSAIAPFYMDAADSIHNPALAVASGHVLYIYKNLKPFYKFSLPSMDVNPTEVEAWNQVQHDKIDISALREMLSSLGKGPADLPLTPRSLRFLQIQETSEMEQFVTRHKEAPLKRNTVITCMTTVKRSISEEKALSCIVIGTENRDVLFIEPDAFTVLATTILSSVPVLFDVSCRDCSLYSVKRGYKNAKLLIQLTAHAIGMTQVNSNIVVACMDQTLNCYNSKGIVMWTISLQGQPTAMEGLDVEMLGIKLVAVALDTGQVHIFHDKHRVDLIDTTEVINAMKYGKYGRESGTLVMISRKGSLTIRILKRTVKFQARDTSATASVSSRLILPKKTKLFIDQTMRERHDYLNIHRSFQQDLYRLKLLSARSFVRAISSNLQPVPTGTSDALKVSAQVHGLGPVFKLVLQIVNHSETAMTLIFLAFDFDPKIYSLSRTHIPVPYIVPNFVYAYDCIVRCISGLNVTDTIKVFVMKEGEASPTMTAIINMPASEVVA